MNFDVAFRGGRMLRRNLRVMRRTWWVPVSGLAEPVFYLLSIGIGLGRLVGPIDGYPFQAYVAPALLAASAMNGAVYEATFNVYFKLKYARVYDAVLATPMGAGDVANGEIVTATARGSVYSAVFVAMMWGLGDVRSPWACLDLPAAVLVGFAFAATGMAATTYMRGWTDFDLVQLALLPMFLFSGTFYPLSTYPAWVRALVEATPLYHGVALERGLTLGALSPSLAGHAAYLAAMGAAGVAIAGRRIRSLLLA